MAYAASHISIAANAMLFTAYAMFFAVFGVSFIASAKGFAVNDGFNAARSGAVSVVGHDFATSGK